MAKLVEDAHPVDVYVGSRIKLRRTLLGISQERLGDALELTFQQVQKYERGSNRVSASKLYTISEVLDVPIAYFFDGYGGDARAEGLRDSSSPAFEHEQLSRKESIDLLKAYYEIEDSKVRRKVIEMIRVLAGTASEAGNG
ncbi:helix-turn-helix domain-containing protein [Zavarzinia compransoris]|uniref:Transcriptional regulator n=1 Tax=Zavarzinia compransoris TaxID=1264899 RepID=A0A317E2R7_9PROT|nr:helix-turn-helix transcriptional regulator [Zavarzinia compransoris]PWR20892.1 transcriptional regulator [Zavarzinia compransoris]TDP44270.1 transcriptional regulator with XRE-family HTH domain [Zavarzinia compransoris]